MSHRESDHWNPSFTHGHRNQRTRAETLWNPVCAERELRLDPRVNQAPRWLGVGARVPPWLEEAVGRIRAFIFPWRRSRSSGHPPGATPSRLHLQLPGQSGTPPALFRPFFTSPGEWREAPSPLAGLGIGGARSGALSGLTPPGCGPVAGTLETRAGFREGLSRGDIPEGLGVQLCESNQWNKRTAPGASLFEGGGREERLCRMGGGGSFSSALVDSYVL